MMLASRLRWRILGVLAAPAVTAAISCGSKSDGRASGTSGAESAGAGGSAGVDASEDGDSSLGDGTDAADAAVDALLCGDADVTDGELTFDAAPDAGRVGVVCYEPGAVLDGGALAPPLPCLPIDGGVALPGLEEPDCPGQPTPKMAHGAIIAGPVAAVAASAPCGVACCYLQTQSCEGRPLFVDGVARTARVVRSSAWC
jgi:hypothetical protein